MSWFVVAIVTLGCVLAAFALFHPNDDDEDDGGLDG